MNHKNLKNLVRTTLQHKTPQQACKILKDYKFKQLKGSLKGLLFDPDALIRFRVSELMGIVSKNEANENIENVRDLMRQLMWNLNEESGGIGWGSIEAMAEIAVKNNKIFKEFFKIIISYSDPESSSFLDHPDLHPGAAWAVGRLLKSAPEKGDYAKYVIKVLLEHRNPQVIGCALWAASHIRDMSGIDRLIKNLVSDNRHFILYEESRLETHNISDVAAKIINI